ncbi:MAG: hypothetical protein V7709_06875 [Halioglobus sp.]
MMHSLKETSAIRYRAGDPITLFEQWSKAGAQQDGLLLVDFQLTAYWREERSEVPLTAVYLKEAGRVWVSVTNAPLSQPLVSVSELYWHWVEQHDLLAYELGQPIGLSALAIPKPWGREIWYTGVEGRGVCALEHAGQHSPIPWLQAVLPGSVLGRAGEPLVLLKILDPDPEPVIGDLYFELHEEKQEVYVVTHIDKAAWPDGTGYIRMGFADEKLSQYHGDSAGFRSAYLSSVKAYERVRRQIDAIPEHGQVDESLREQESALRTKMDAYSQLRPLRLGDVVKVPLLTPHSLQHGVRTVEFQTPVYERKILSFAQEVLTQSHWDTTEAVEQMHLQTAQPEKFETLFDNDGVFVERIVDFSDFEVRRVRISADAELSLGPMQPYGVIMVVDGRLVLGGQYFGPEEALIVPRGWSGKLVSDDDSKSVLFLLAIPRH